MTELRQIMIRAMELKNLSHPHAKGLPCLSKRDRKALWAPDMLQDSLTACRAQL
jgi:hypothetical protein